MTRRPLLTNIRRSREAGIFGLLVFVWGVLLLPIVHHVNHRNDHEHGPAGSHRHGVAFGGHAHHDDEHEHDHHHQHEDEHEIDHRDDDHDHAARPSHHHHGEDDDHEDDDRSPFDPEHGRGSLEHFSAAVTPAQVFVFLVSYELIDQAVVSNVESAFVERYELGPVQPRAPPV